MLKKRSKKSRATACFSRPIMQACIWAVRLAQLAVQHYVVVGERKGFRPHPREERRMRGFDCLYRAVRRNQCHSIDRIRTGVVQMAESGLAAYVYTPVPSLQSSACCRAGTLRPCIDLQKLSQTWGLVGADLVTRMYTEINTHGRLPPTYASYTIEELGESGCGSQPSRSRS